MELIYITFITAIVIFGITIIASILFLHKIKKDSKDKK